MSDRQDATDTYCSKPFGKRQTIVARKSKQLPRAGGQGTDRYHDQKDRDDAHEACRPTDAFRRVLEDVNERVSGRARERFLYVSNAEGIAKRSSVIWQTSIRRHLLT
jgi:DNA topoisomerase IA